MGAPCHPISNTLSTLHESFFSRYHIDGCGVWRGDTLPISWQGDGLAKWNYLLALNGLAVTCPQIARLVLSNHPVDILDDLFQRFRATQVQGSVAKPPAAYEPHWQAMG